jgi:hypothetical protein
MIAGNNACVTASALTDVQSSSPVYWFTLDQSRGLHSARSATVAGMEFGIYTGNPERAAGIITRCQAIG